MSFKGGDQAVFKIDSTDGGSLVDISEYVKNVKLSTERDEQELPRLGGNPKGKLVGPPGRTLELEGWYDPTVDAILQSAIDAASPVTRSFEYAPQGTDTGNKKRTGEAYISKYELEDDAEDPGGWTASLSVDSYTAGSY